MPFQRKRSALVLEEKDVEFLENLAASRTETYSKVKRAKMLLAYARGESISSIARKEQTDRPVVERCVDKALSGGIMTALRDLARSGRPSAITDEDKAWVIHLACSKLLMTAHMEPFDDRTMEPLEDRGYGATPRYHPKQ